MAIEKLLLTTTAMMTFSGNQLLTNASGFFFENNGRLFVVTSRHVLIDEANNHRPDRIEIELHTDHDNATRSVRYSIPLYQKQQSVWQQGMDSAGIVDVAAIEIDQSALPEEAFFAAFSPRHLHQALETIEIGTPMLVVGFPLGFHDTLHHLPVARHAINASSFALRFRVRVTSSPTPALTGVQAAVQWSCVPTMWERTFPGN
jgi:hypothetical protein